MEEKVLPFIDLWIPKPSIFPTSSTIQENNSKKSQQDREFEELDPLEKVVQEKWPTFTRTGWRLRSSYDPIPQSMREILIRFFNPFNQVLFQMISKYDESWKE